VNETAELAELAESGSDLADAESGRDTCVRVELNSRKATAGPWTRSLAQTRSQFVTFLNLHGFLTSKSFVFSVGFGEKSKKLQALRMTKLRLGSHR
jgi:hypothetical protein